MFPHTKLLSLPNRGITSSIWTCISLPCELAAKSTVSLNYNEDYIKFNDNYTVQVSMKSFMSILTTKVNYTKWQIIARLSRFTSSFSYMSIQSQII